MCFTFATYKYKQVVFAAIKLWWNKTVKKEQDKGPNLQIKLQQHWCLYTALGGQHFGY